MGKRKCVVVKKDMSAADVARIRAEQRNIKEQKHCAMLHEESALADALRGSKEYLKSQGYILEE